MKEAETQNEIDKKLRDDIIRAVRSHATKSQDKVLSCIRIKWNQAGQNLSINGYSIEYKDKHRK